MPARDLPPGLPPRTARALRALYHAPLRGPAETTAHAAVNHVLQGPHWTRDSFAALPEPRVPAALAAHGLRLRPRADALPRWDAGLDGVRALLCRSGAAWYCLRRVGAQWVNLNHAMRRPAQLNARSFVQCLQQLEDDGHALFIVDGQLPPCAADEELVFEEDFPWGLVGGLYVGRTREVRSRSPPASDYSSESNGPRDDLDDDYHCDEDYDDDDDDDDDDCDVDHDRHDDDENCSYGAAAAAVRGGWNMRELQAAIVASLALGGGANACAGASAGAGVVACSSTSAPPLAAGGDSGHSSSDDGALRAALAASLRGGGEAGGGGGDAAPPAQGWRGGVLRFV